MNSSSPQTWDVFPLTSLLSFSSVWQSSSCKLFSSLVKSVPILVVFDFKQNFFHAFLLRLLIVPVRNAADFRTFHPPPLLNSFVLIALMWSLMHRKL